MVAKAVRSLAVTTGLAIVVIAGILYRPALPRTDARETTAVRLTPGVAPPTETEQEAYAAASLPETEVAAAVLNFASSQVLAAIDSEKARYSAVYTGTLVITDFWNGNEPRTKRLTVQRLTPHEDPKVAKPEIASSFSIDLELFGEPEAGKFLVRPAEATITRAMAKLLDRNVCAPATWFADTTTLLNVEIQWKVEDLSGHTTKVSEAVVGIAGYDMTSGDDDVHANLFARASGGVSKGAAEASPDGKRAPVVGVLDFPHTDDKDSGLYRITVTVTEKDPLNVDRSVEAEKTLFKDVIDAVKQAAASAKP